MARYDQVTIEAIAAILPPHHISSLELEQEIAGTLERLGVPLGNLERLTGIRERRFWDLGVMPSEVATLAAEEAIAAAGVDRSRIGCLINTSVSKDYIEPSVACLVHGALRLPDTCRNFDIGNACLGFIDGVEHIALMIQAGLIEYGLVVDGERAREPVEATLEKLKQPGVSEEVFRKNFATLTIGSGAAAMVLTHRDRTRTGHVINGAVSLADTRHNRLSLAQRFGGETDSQALLSAGVALAKKAWPLAVEQLPNWSDETIDLYAPHQVSVRHIAALNKALGLTPEKVFLNVQELGNTGPAAVPITLKMAQDAGRLWPGAHVALLGIGSGLNCSGMSLSWGGG